MNSGIERGGGVAIWRQIAQHLASDIEAGRIAPGAKLPTEAELARRFAVNRHTVRRAVGDLEDRGLVRVQQGRGTFAFADTIDYRLSQRTRFSENIRRNRQAPGGLLLSAETVPAARAVAEALRLDPGTPVLRLESLRTANGAPVALATHNLPAARFAGLATAIERHGALTPALAEFGVHDYTRAETRVWARPTGRSDARILSLSESEPVLVTDALNLDCTGTPIEFTRTRYPADRVQLIVESDP
jgi:GntR family phosphonate transport system transcriptional regulator